MIFCTPVSDGQGFEICTGIIDKITICRRLQNKLNIT